ncbi:MAG TPA: rhodanese-like domain-containing protein [Acetobacteraceae bacterium]|nr:rhodanese-like domain-containing protein [Acetobacteraceae bacterium]
MVENVSSAKTWEALRADPMARLVDVRTDVEWASVGIPDTSETGTDPILIPWQVAPSMQVNAAFVEQMRQAGLTSEHKLYFICRSGARSMAAARAAMGAGFAHAYNVADGFEGAPNMLGRRGTVSGWKAEGLPWRRR